MLVWVLFWLGLGSCGSVWFALSNFGSILVVLGQFRSPFELSWFVLSCFHLFWVILASLGSVQCSFQVFQERFGLFWVSLALLLDRFGVLTETWKEPKQPETSQSEPKPVKKTQINCEATRRDPKFQHWGKLEFSASFCFSNFERMPKFGYFGQRIINFLIF